MGQDKDGVITKDTRNFVSWFQELTPDKKDFASALLIANLPDEQLLRIKDLTEKYGWMMIGFEDALNSKQGEPK